MDGGAFNRGCCRDGVLFCDWRNARWFYLCDGMCIRLGNVAKLLEVAMTQLDLLPVYPRSSQAQLWTLLEALRRGERLTVLTALDRYKVFACSQRMTELRKLGWPISSKMVEVESGKHVAQYTLE